MAVPETDLACRHANIHCPHLGPLWLVPRTKRVPLGQRIMDYEFGGFVAQEARHTKRGKVYVRGKLAHADHGCVNLDAWHLAMRIMDG